MQRGDRFFSSLTGEKAHEAAALSGQKTHSLYSAKLLHLLLHHLFCDVLRGDIAQEKRRHALIVRWRRRLGLFLDFVHDLLRDRVVDPVEALSNFLVYRAIALLQTLQVLVRDVGVAIRAGDASVAVPFNEEGAHMGSVSLGRLRTT